MSDRDNYKTELEQKGCTKKEIEGHLKVYDKNAVDFTKAINTDVLDNMNVKDLESIANILGKIKYWQFKK